MDGLVMFPKHVESRLEEKDFVSMRQWFVCTVLTKTAYLVCNNGLEGSFQKNMKKDFQLNF